MTPYADLFVVQQAGEHFWTCWGVFHAKGRLLGNWPGDLTDARCYVASNETPHELRARGTIRNYGVQGVCHQVSNQILAAATNPGKSPTVRGSKGYGASSFVYGTYGLDKDGWRQRQAFCQTGVTPISRGTPDSMAGFQIARPQAMEDFDDFEEHAAAVLRDRADLLRKLVSLRLDCQYDLTQLARTAPSAAELNANNQRLLDRAAELLGPEYFEQIFGYLPGQRIDLIDPEFFEE